MKSISPLDQTSIDPVQSGGLKRGLTRRLPAPLVLEPRIMFDGASADAALAAAQATEVPADASSASADSAAREAAVPAAVSAPAPRHEIMFVADNVQDVARLVAGVPAGIEVILLDHTRDGLAQMLAALEGRAPVDALHLVSHGDDARLMLGATVIDADNLDSYTAPLAQLGAHLAQDADLLVYGCDVGAGGAGQAFIARLGQLTGADVAASVDRTGTVGDWQLEAHSGAIESAAVAFDGAGWSGELVTTTVFDANWQALTFTNATSVSGSGTGRTSGDVMRFSNVITINGQSIDALVTTTLDRATLSAYDSPSNPSATTSYFQPNLNASAIGGNATFSISFVLGGGATAATLQNVVVNSYDIDSTGASDRQFQSFQGFARYEVSNSTKLAAGLGNNGLVTFLYTSDAPVNNGNVTADPFRVRVYYDSMSTFQVNAGVSGGTGTAYFAFDFSVGPDWSGATTVTGNPAPTLSFSGLTLPEAAANDGSISATATITLNNGVFSGTNGAPLAGLSFSNLPAGLTAQVTRTGDSTAVLSFSGNALAHANANDVANLGISFGNAAFVSGNAGAVTGASRADLKLDFIDPGDAVAPTVAANQSFAYAENRTAGALLGTVTASDNVGVNAMRFASSGTSTSADGFFHIGSDGRITLSAAGAAVATASNDFETGANSFVHAVQARDAVGNWSSAVNVTLQLTNLDELAPLFSSGAAANAAENQNVLYTAAAADLVDFTDGVVTYSLKPGSGDAALLAINGSSGVVTRASGTLDFETRAAYSFTVIAVDASGNTREQAVAVAVTDGDEVAPTLAISADRSTLKAGETALLTFVFSEDIGASFSVDDISVGAGTLGAFTRIDATHYTALYTPAANAALGGVNVAVAIGRVQDGAANSNLQGASLLLSIDTAAPVIAGPGGAAGAASTIEVAENTLAVHGFGAGEAVSWSLAGGQDAARFTLGADGALRFVAAPDYETPQDGAAEGSNTYQVAVRAIDGAGNASTQLVTVRVTNVNETPVAAPATVSTPEDTPLAGALPPASDVDGDSVTYAKVADPMHGSVTVATDGSYVYTPSAGYHGADSFQYSVSDPGGASSTYTVTVTVTPENDAPVAAPAAIATVEDQAVTGTLPAAFDAEGDAVSYALAGAAAHGSVIVGADGSYRYTPNADYHGADSFSYTVDDSQGGSNTYTVAVTVTPLNDAPTAAPAAIVTLEDTLLRASLPAAFDADGDAVTYSAAVAPAHGLLAIAADGSFSYTPEADYHGADSFRYTVADGQGGSSTYTVSVTVIPVDDAPLANGGAVASATIGQPLAPVALPAFTDIDSARLTYSATLADGGALPAWMAFDPATGSIAGTPPAGSAGTYALRIAASDGELSASAILTINVGSPAMPTQTVTIDLMAKDSGVSARDFVTNDGSAGRAVSGTISAPLTANQVVQVSFDGGASWQGASVDGLSWRAIDSGAHDGNWRIAARVGDAVAGASGPAASQEVLLDRAQPAAPTVDSISTGSPTPVLSGSATVLPGETLLVTVNGAVYEVIPQAGRWSLDLASATPRSGVLAGLLPGQAYDVTAAVSDAAGNVRSGAERGIVAIAVPQPVIEPVLEPVLAPPPLAAPSAVVAAPLQQITPVAEPVPVAPVSVTLTRVAETSVPGSTVGVDSQRFGDGNGARALDSSFALNLRGAELSDVYTRSDGFRTVVAKADQPALVLFQGVPDQFVETGRGLSLTIPADAFAHTQPKATVRLTAVLQDGSPLPAWVEFNAQTGQFTGEVPKGLQGELRIKLVARDMEGREATALFRINVGQERGAQLKPEAALGKPGLSQQLRATPARAALRA